jgi:hypothetical protein
VNFLYNLFHIYCYYGPFKTKSLLNNDLRNKAVKAVTFLMSPEAFTGHSAGVLPHKLKGTVSRDFLLLVFL